MLLRFDPSRVPPVTPALIQSAAEAVERRLWRAGYRRFQNGGLPLLERRRDGWIEEILLRSRPLDGDRAELWVDVHLASGPLQTLRQTYWEPASRAPLLVASGDLGRLDIPPALLRWPTGGDPATFAAIAERIEELALPWLRLFRDEACLERLSDGTVPLVDVATGLELTLLEGGDRAGRRYVARRLDTSEFWDEVEGMGGYAATEHLAPLARAARLCTARRLLD